MTRIEWMKQASEEDVAIFLCDSIECAENCPGYDLCGWGNGKANGLLKWLREEMDET